MVFILLFIGRLNIRKGWRAAVAGKKIFDDFPLIQSQTIQIIDLVIEILFLRSDLCRSAGQLFPGFSQQPQKLVCAFPRRYKFGMTSLSIN